MVSSGARGGIAVITKRHAKANNPLIGAQYDPELPTSWISYMDANNLYGWALSQRLPYGLMEWMSPEEIATIDWATLSDESDTGYMVECDLD